MSRKRVGLLCMLLYSLILIFTAFMVGRLSYKQNTQHTSVISEKTEEDVFTAKEKNGKLAIYKEDRFVMSLDTNLEMLPKLVRSQIKKGISFKASELPGLLEAFAE